MAIRAGSILGNDSWNTTVCRICAACAAARGASPVALPGPQRALKTLLPGCWRGSGGDWGFMRRPMRPSSIITHVFFGAVVRSRKGSSKHCPGQQAVEKCHGKEGRDQSVQQMHIALLIDIPRRRTPRGQGADRGEPEYSRRSLCRWTARRPKRSARLTDQSSSPSR